MKKVLTFILVMGFLRSGYSQADSTEVLYAFLITDYQVKLNDSVTVVQVSFPPSIPVSVKKNQIGILKHRYENGSLDTSLIGWGRCHLIKGDYYYFAIHKYRDEEPVQGNILYTKCKTPVYFMSPLFDINRNAISLTTVMEDQFYHTAELFYLNAEKEKAILDSMVADIRYTAKAMKEQSPGQDQLIEGGMFEGKKLFDAMQETGVYELNEFLKYIVARPAKYAGNIWKLSEVFATWIINKAPQVIEE